MTAEGVRALRAEARRLWRETRPDVVRALAAAAAEGDRSENAEYSYRKKQLGEIDRRLRYLGKRLEEIQVSFGAWVTLERESGDERRYRIVGADETHAGRGWISVDSPMARALLGKAIGDEIEVETPGGRDALVITEVVYGCGD